MSSPVALRCKRRGVMRVDGQALSATQRPSIRSSTASGGTGSCMNARSIGASMMPVSRPLSQWSHQRVASCRKPQPGPGVAMCAYWCDHCPIQPIRGALSPASSRGMALL